MDESVLIPGVDALEPIGTGRTSTVLRGRDRRSGRPVAVKLLHARLDEPAAVERFEHDLDTVRTLTTPYVERVYSRGRTEDGRPWVVVAHLPEHLPAIVAEHGPISWREAVAVGRQACEALDAAHRSGLLHGRLSPERLRFDATGLTQVADLGLGASVGPVVPAETPARGLAHVAPEIIRGGSASTRSDVYSLASTLYAALSGHAPFGDGDDDEAAALMDRVLHARIVPLTRFGVPYTIDEVIRGALARDPEGRPSSADELGRRLAAAGREATQPPVVKPPVIEPSAPRALSALDGPVSALDDHGAPTPESSSREPRTLVFDDTGSTSGSVQRPVLDDLEAAPLLAVVAHQNRRRFREHRVLTWFGIAAFVGGVGVGAYLGWSHRNHRPARAAITTVPIAPDTTALETTTVPLPSTSQPNPQSFLVSFDVDAKTATLSGSATAAGAEQLQKALSTVDKVTSRLDVRTDSVPTDATVITDAVTLLAAMQQHLVAGALSFDGFTFSITGAYREESGRRALQAIIDATRTPVGRPALRPIDGTPPDTSPISDGGDASGGATVGDGAVAGTGITVTPGSFTIPVDDRYHVFPVAFSVVGDTPGSVCLVSRSISGPTTEGFVMNFSSCSPSTLVTIRAVMPGKYTVTDTFFVTSASTGATVQTSITFTVFAA